MKDVPQVPFEIPTYKIKCLKCNEEFESEDKKRNRLCYACNVSNKTSGRIYGLNFDSSNFK